MENEIVDELCECLRLALEHVEIRKNNEYDDRDVVEACDVVIERSRKALDSICRKD